MGIRNKQVPATIVIPIVAFLLYVFWSVAAFGSTFQHYIQQVRRTDGQVMAGAQVQVFLPGSNTRATIYSNISGTTVKSQPILTDSIGFFDFYLGDQVVDVLIQGNNFPTTKLTNVTLSALATAGVLTVPNGGTGATFFTLNSVLLGNSALPIKTSSAGLANQVFRVPNAGGQPDFGQINLGSSAAVTGVLPAANGGTGSTNGSVLRVREQDGAPSVPNVTEVRVSNGTLTDVGGGVVSIAISALPVVDSTSIVFGSGDSSKQMRFEVDGFSASTIRVLTPPNADITIAGADFANAWADGVKQTFNPNATTAGINIGAHTADPSVPVNGDTFYNSTTNKFRCYENGAWSNCIGSGSGTPGGADTNVQFNDGGSFGGESNFIWNKTAKFFGIGATAALMDEAIIATNLASHNGVIASLRANNDAPPGNSAGFRAFKARGTVGAPSAVQSGDWMLGLSSNGYDSTGYFGTARLYSEATENHTNTNHGSRWTFSTTPDASTTITDTARFPQWGGVQLLTGTKPTCSVTVRGSLYLVAGGAGVADTYEACDKDSADVYAWRSIHGPPGFGSSDASLYDPGKYQLVRNYALESATSLNILSDGEPSGLSVIGNASSGSGPAGRFVIQTTTAATTGNRAGFNSTATLFQIQWDNQVAITAGEIAFRVLLEPSGAVTNMRHWTGISQEDAFDEATSTPAANYAWFRYATDVDGTAFWRTCTDDGGGSPTCNTTTVAVAANTLYRFRIRWAGDGSYVKFYNDDVLLFTHTTNLPSTTALNRWVSVTKALANESKSVGMQWVNWWY